MYAGHAAAVDVVHESWLPPRSHSPTRKKGRADELVIDEVEMDLIGNRIGFQHCAIADLGDERHGKIISRRQRPGQRIRHQGHACPRGITCFGDQENTKLSGSRLPDDPNVYAHIANQCRSLIISFSLLFENDN